MSVGKIGRLSAAYLQRLSALQGDIYAKKHT